MRQLHDMLTSKVKIRSWHNCRDTVTDPEHPIIGSWKDAMQVWLQQLTLQTRDAMSWCHAISYGWYMLDHVGTWYWLDQTSTISTSKSSTSHWISGYTHYTPTVGSIWDASASRESMQSCEAPIEPSLPSLQSGCWANPSLDLATLSTFATCPGKVSGWLLLTSILTIAQQCDQKWSEKKKTEDNAKAWMNLSHCIRILSDCNRRLHKPRVCGPHE